MSFETTRQMIAAFVDGITLAFPVEWEGGRNKPADAKTWGRWSIQQGERNPATIGHRGFTRATGILWLQVFIPEEGGTKAGTIAADAVAAALDYLTIASGDVYATFDLCGMVDAGRRNGYTQKNISCGFTVERNPAQFFYLTTPGWQEYTTPDGLHYFTLSP